MANKHLTIFQTPTYCFDVDYGYQLAKNNNPPELLEESIIKDYYRLNMKDGQVIIRDNYDEVNVDHPVLFSWNPENQQYLLIDGNHRMKKVYKALKKGKCILLYAYYLNKTDSKKIIFTRGSNGHGYIPYSNESSYNDNDIYYSSSYSSYSSYS